jgi:hypothetical protein
LFAALPVDAQYYPLEVPRLVMERSTDGLIVIGAHLSQGTTALLEDGPPAILVDAYAEDLTFDSVVSDNIGGARAAVEHLIGLGHRDIALIGSRPDSSGILQRRRGYEQAIAEAELQRTWSRPTLHRLAAAAAGLWPDPGDGCVLLQRRRRHRTGQGAERAGSTCRPPRSSLRRHRPRPLRLPQLDDGGRLGMSPGGDVAPQPTQFSAPPRSGDHARLVAARLRAGPHRIRRSPTGDRRPDT